MVNDQQVKRLWQLAGQLSLEIAAAKSGMDPKTARKYLGDRRLPREMRGKHTWRTRPDPFRGCLGTGSGTAHCRARITSEDAV